ncbi:hypothetical protein ACROYT_G034372 [Oculina patagonica]
MITPLRILVAVIFLPHAFSLQCYECDDSPDFPGVPDCDSDNVGKITCDHDQLQERCVTMNYNLSLGKQNGSLLIQMKKCSTSLMCNPQFKQNWCKAYELTGQVSNCSFDCCECDLCNDPSTKCIVTPKPVSSSVLGLAANFDAILSAVVLTVFKVY